MRSRGSPAGRTMLAVVLAATGIGLATAAEASAARAGCTQLRQGQHLKVTLSWHYYERWTRLTQSMTQEVKILFDETRPFATLNIGGATCKRPGGTWQVIDPIAVAYASAGINAVGTITGSGKSKGWGIGIRSASGGAIPKIALQIMHCGQGNFFKVLKEVVGVPLPIGIIPSLALWGGGKLLPSDKVSCGNVGVRPVRIYANKVGWMRVADVGSHAASERVFIPSVPANPNLQWSIDRGYDIKPISVAGP